MTNRHNTLTVLTIRWGIFPQYIGMGQMYMTDAGTKHNNCMLPAPPVGGLPNSQDRLDRMKLFRDRTIPIILPSGKNILADTMFKIIIGYTNLGMRQIKCRLVFKTESKKMRLYENKLHLFAELLNFRYKQSLSFLQY